MQAWDKTYFCRVNFTVSSLWVATMILAFLLYSISSSIYSKHLGEKQRSRELEFGNVLSEPQRALIIIIQDLLMIHPVSGLIVWVYWVFIANLLSPGSLLVHVGSTNQLGTKVPVLPPWQLNIQSYIVIRVLKALKDKNQKIGQVSIFLK